MALNKPVTNDIVAATDVSDIVDHLEGASGTSLAWFFRTLAANNFIVRLSDAAGAQKFSIQDSAGVEVAYINSDGALSAASTSFTNLDIPTSASPSQTTDGRAVWDSDDDRLTIGTGSAAKVIGLLRGAGSNASATQEIVYDTTADVLKIWDGSVSQTVSGVKGLVNDLRDTNALLALYDGSMGAATDAISIGLGLRQSIETGCSITQTDTRGGAVSLVVGTTADQHTLIKTNGRSAMADRNPYMTTRLTSSAGAAALKSQFWGFLASDNMSDATVTTVNKAGFRSATTGAIVFVTGNATSEETTTVTASHTLGTAGMFEVSTTDDGVTWIGKIAGTTVATHTTQVPVVTTGMNVLVGIENNTTTGVSITVLDNIAAYCDRT